MTKKILTLQATGVKIGERVRKDPGNITELGESLVANGQIQPIVVSNGELVAGFRRLTAAIFLGAEDPPRSIKGLDPGQILAVDFKDLEEYDQLLIEYEENVYRKQFSKAEEALAIAKLKTVFEAKDGKTITTRQMAKKLGRSKGHVSMALTVAEAVKGGRAELLQANSVAGAYRSLKTKVKLEELIARSQKERPDKVMEYKEALHCGDAIKWISKVPDASIDFVNFDPPWGIGIDSYDRHHHYGTFDDDAETGIQTAVNLVPELYRVLREDTYAVAWFGIQYYERLYTLLESVGFKVFPVPFMWFKTNKKGSQNDPARTTINAYEPFFLVAKGDPRMFATGRSNVLSYPMVDSSARIHYAQKPVDLMGDILERFSFGSMAVLDPTFGSGSVFVAADRLGRSFVGCEKDKDNHQKCVELLVRNVPSAVV